MAPHSGTSSCVLLFATCHLTPACCVVHQPPLSLQVRANCTITTLKLPTGVRPFAILVPYWSCTADNNVRAQGR